MYECERYFIPLHTEINTDILMTGISANCNSVSRPKTANSCGLTLSAAIRRVKASTGSPSAAIPETVIIGDRGLEPKAAHFAQESASQLFTLLYIIKQNFRQDDHQNLHRKAPSRQTEDHSRKIGRRDSFCH